MLRALSRSYRSELINGYRTILSLQGQIWRRAITDLSERRKGFETKYADKLLERARREGMASVEELKAKVATHSRPPGPVIQKPSDSAHKTVHRELPDMLVRKDSSPVKPLADFMDLKKIMSKNPTTEQISTLWMSYHASRSQGTGRGYLSATIPLASYLKMTALATKYPSFLLPLPHPPLGPDAQGPAHDFHFLQWGFHETPPHPSQTLAFPFDAPPPSARSLAMANPAYSTILVTPLQEYKLRQTFAQPQLVLTHYTDLATTHGIVLMRGELTASPSSPEKYLLSQVDAQLLAMGVQRFFLPTDDARSVERIEMLRRFHETPADFRWEDLLEFADPTT